MPLSVSEIRSIAHQEIVKAGITSVELNNDMRLEELGIDSVIATEITWNLEKTLGFEIDVWTLWGCETVGEFIAALGEAVNGR